MLRHLLGCLVVILSLPVCAQQLAPFGDPFPLSNTRYVPIREFVSDFFAPEAPLLRTNGADAFVFLADLNGLRVARVEAAPRIARLVLPFAVTSSYLFDVVWTGSHFLVVAVDRARSYEMWGRLVDGDGEPDGEPFLMGTGLFPALAFNGRYVLMIHSHGGENQSTVLLPDGSPAPFAPQLLPNPLSVERAAVTSNGSRFAAVIPRGGLGAPAFVLFDENGQILTQQTLADELSWAIASDGNRFLAFHAHAFASALWLFDSDGALRATRSLLDAEQRFYRDPLAVWSGTRWVLSRVASNEGQVLELDAEAAEIVSTSWVHNSQVAPGVLGGTVIGAWWANREIVVGPLPFEAGVTPVALQAADQRLLGTATSHHAALFLWNEAGGLRAGVRLFDGRWREHVLAPVAGNVLAASDGDGFVVIVDGEVLRLDTNGERIPGSPLGSTPFLPTSIEWNGARYGIIGVDDDGRIVAAALTESGLSAPAVVATPTEPTGAPVLNSSGGRFLAAWSLFSCEVECFAERIDAVPLSPSLQPAGPVVAVTADEAITGAFGLGWNGSRHVLAYSTSTGAHSRDIEPTGSLGERREITEEFAPFLQVFSEQDAVVIAWVDPTRLIVRGVTLSRSGALSEPLLIHEEPYLNEWGGTLTALPDGRLAFAFYAPQRGAPFHASLHLELSIAGATAVPGAPRASLRGNVLSWAAPPEPGVTGYRVEQRIGDDEWTELDRWFDADELSLVLPAPPDPAVSFRVRAFSDGGAGPYSEPVQRLSRRRSARS
jgi:hypothetical protein